MSDWLDRPGPIRSGQGFDTERLAAYLEAEVPELAGAQLRVEQFPSGYSNLTYLVGAGARSVVLRRPPVGVEIATAHDMGREFRILSHLSPVYPKAPRPIAFCDDAGVIGTPFYLMERVEGLILRKEMPPEMMPSAETTPLVARGLIDTLAELHAVDFEGAGLGDLGRPAGYVHRQVEGWSRRYEQARTDDVADAGRVSEWLRDSIPAESDATLVHNDFKHDNVVLDPNDWSRVVAVLDWEMTTLGDPLMDLGTTLAYWTQDGDPPELLATRLSPTMLPGTPGRAEVLELYARATGRDVGHIVFYYAFGLFKVAVIVQQLYHRYVTGRTTDARFANLIEGVRALCAMAWRAVERDRIDDLF